MIWQCQKAQLVKNRHVAVFSLKTKQNPPNKHECVYSSDSIMDTLGFEPRAFRMRSGCDTTTPCAHVVYCFRENIHGKIQEDLHFFCYNCKTIKK